MLELPFDPDVFRQSKIFRLNEIDTKITLYWQPTDENWYLNLEVPEGTPILYGRRITNEQSVMHDIQTPLNGDIVCEKLQRIPPIRENPKRSPWGRTHRLVFRTRD